MDLRIAKGLETRQLIYDTAKNEFYKHGYKKTTIQTVTQTADVQRGLFAYYFSTKDHLVEVIYGEYLDAIYQLLRPFEWFDSETAFFQHSMVSYIYYYNILSDSNIARFYYEVLRRESNERVLIRPISDIYHRFVADYGIDLKQCDFDSLLHYDFGGRREVFINYFSKHLDIGIEDLVFNIVYTMAFAIRIPHEEIKRVNAKVHEYFNEIDSSSVRML
ncbi:MAG: TetR/AcrR family transcriptional regulator [Anaerofustis sp.]